MNALSSKGALENKHNQEPLKGSNDNSSIKNEAAKRKKLLKQSISETNRKRNATEKSILETAPACHANKK